MGAGRAPALQGQLWHSVQNDPKSVSEHLSPLSPGLGHSSLPPAPIGYLFPSPAQPCKGAGMEAISLSFGRGK